MMQRETIMQREAMIQRDDSLAREISGRGRQLFRQGTSGSFCDEDRQQDDGVKAACLPPTIKPPILYSMRKSIREFCGLDVPHLDSPTRRRRVRRTRPFFCWIVFFAFAAIWRRRLDLVRWFISFWHGKAELRLMQRLGLNQFAASFAAVAVGFASQNIASNCIAGLMILLFQPFKVSDFIKIAGIEGQVKSITLSGTTIKTTFDGNDVTLNNSQVLAGPVTKLGNSSLRSEVLKLTLAPGTRPEAVRATIKLAVDKVDKKLAAAYARVGAPSPNDKRREKTCYLADIGISGQQTWHVGMKLPHQSRKDGDLTLECTSTMLECISSEIGDSGIQHAKTMY